MTIYHGKNTRLYINGYDISSLVAGVTPVQEVELAAYAVCDGVYGYHQMPGLTKDAMNLDGIFDDNYQGQLNALFSSATGYQIVIPLGTALSDRALACNAIRFNKYLWRGIVTDINRLTGEFLAENLPWEECKIIFPKAQKTADGNHTVIDNAVASILGFSAYLQVFECAAGDALIVKVQHSTDNFAADIVDLVTFTAANGITTERKAITAKSGTADATEANKLHDADGGFTATDVGSTVWNTTDNTYTTVSGFVDEGELDLTDDIMVSTETYTVGAVRRYVRVLWTGTLPYTVTFAVVSNRR